VGQHLTASRNDGSIWVYLNRTKYHVVFTPKYRKKQLFGKIKRHLGQVFHDLARRKECRIWIAQNVERKMRNFLGHKFWARGYFVTIVGRDEEVIRAYIRNQELADRQLEQFELKISAAQNPINRPNIP
jgi:putative transposase